MTARLDILGQHHGIVTRRRGPDGRTHDVPAATLGHILHALGVDPDTLPAAPPAAHDLCVPPDGRCYCPAWLEGSRAWGLFCQLYELRSARNAGIGDFRDLRDLAAIAAKAGADFLGINPLHALFGADPGRCSPFSPSNRRFLNPLYIALDDIEGVPPPEPVPDAGPLIDYPKVARDKYAALGQIFASRPFGHDDQLRTDFDAFCVTGGAALHDHALFEAISHHMVAQGHGAGWTQWPEAFHDRRGRTVARFVRAHADAIRFQQWQQWLAARQLAQVQKTALAAGMRIGLFLDLAVGDAPDGSAVWGAPGAVLAELRIGAPPDIFATDGQDWGLAVPHPQAGQGAHKFRAMIDAQLGAAGALRMDHVMGLWQLFVIPEGASPAMGAHLRYAFADRLRLLAAQSHRHRALVIGEDLGFVPDGFREAMQAAGIFSYRIMQFEQDDAGFTPPGSYPQWAMACLSTHDLPTLAGWWQAEDIRLRAAHGLADAGVDDYTARTLARRAMIAALADEAILPADRAAADAPVLPVAVLVAAHRFIARTPAKLAGVRLADLVGPWQATNLPGTTDSYPNWRRRAPVPVDQIAAHPRFRAVTEAMMDERPRR
ncbi:MAG: 4-alpha-glucanotransferase [Paracoccaceae bacterium]